jgi:MFS family permease
MRVRAALDSGARLWHLLVIKNLALLCIVAPLGFLLSGLLAWRAGDLEAFFKACALVICFILLWLGVGNVLSNWLPSRDEPVRQRRQSGSLKQFLIAFTVAYLIGYLVNFMLIWRVFAARALTERLGEAYIPGVLIVLSCLGMWILLAVFAVALAQQPKVRRTLQKEIADDQANRSRRPGRRTSGRDSSAGDRRGETAHLSLRPSAR